MTDPSHYQRLGVSDHASADELRQAFRRLSKRYHPDTTALPPAAAALAFEQLQLAYSVLSDPQQRRLYDASRQLEVAPQRQVEVLNPVRRPLSGGEWLALLLLLAGAVFSLVLGVGLAWLRGADLMQWPSWWLEAR